MKFSRNEFWKWTLIIAGFYNLLWGGWVILFPAYSLLFFGITTPTILEIWQCVGMIVAVYGCGYLIASSDPLKYWPVVLVGLLGKVLGPIGFADAFYRGVFPLKFGINIIFNDLIWWIPFGWILYHALRREEIGSIDEVDFNLFEPRKRAKFINSLTGFKSANLIGTTHNGFDNLSIVSSLVHLGSDPALVGFVIRPDVSPRHTLENIRSSKILTINHVSEEIYRKAHATSARYEEKESEFAHCGLDAFFREDWGAPFVKESYISMSAKLEREIKVEENGTHFLIVRVEKVFLPAGLVSADGHIDLEKAKTVCISGLDSYHQTALLNRLEYAKPFKKVKNLV